VSRRVAPLPPSHIRPQEPVIVVGSLSAATGLGQSARLCYSACAEGGVETYGIDLGKYFRQDRGAGDFAFRDGRECVGPGTLILHVNAPFVPYALALLGRRIVSQKWRVGYWAWELPKVPPDWQRGAEFVHAIWVPSRFAAAAVASVAGGRTIEVVAHPVAAATREIASVERAAHFRVLTVFQASSGGAARKNPLAAIEAFRRAFGTDPTARLIIAALGLDRAPKVARDIRAAIAGLDNIVLDERRLSNARAQTRYENADVLLSLHRSEGFGLVMAEAMAHGLAVVATNWSGNVDYLTPDNGIPIRYDLIPATDPEGVYNNPSTCWAEPDIEEAADALRRLRFDRGLRGRLSRRAQADMRSMLSRERYVARVRQHFRHGQNARMPGQTHE
jgi:glycosyltransferase involved in cell wall biosynthesis